MFTCHDTSRWISDALDGPVAGWKRMLIGSHLAICGPCRRFRRQIALLQRLGAQPDWAERPLRERRLSGAASARIEAELRRRRG